MKKWHQFVSKKQVRPPIWVHPSYVRFSNPVVAAVTQTKEDKQIKILRLQIRLAELNWDSVAASAHASASAPSRTSLSQMPCNLLEEASTPSSGMSLSLSYFNGHSCHDGHNNSFVDNSHMIPTMAMSPMPVVRLQAEWIRQAGWKHSILQCRI